MPTTFRSAFVWLTCIALSITSCNCLPASLAKVSKVKVSVSEPSALVQHLNSSTVALVFTHVETPEADPEKEADPDADPVRPILEVRPYCTGVWLSKDVILTAAHCIHGVAEAEQVGDPSNVVVHYSTNFEAPQPKQEPFGVHLGKVLKLGSGGPEDLALVKALGGEKAIPMHDCVKVADALPGVGEEIWVVGHPKGLYFSTYRGSVAAYRTNLGFGGDDGHWLQAEAPLWFGNSGGGAFDVDGRLLGVVSTVPMVKTGFLSQMPMPSVVYFVDAIGISKFLDGVQL